jgi:hypothetical protein
MADLRWDFKHTIVERFGPSLLFSRAGVGETDDRAVDMRYADFDEWDTACLVL